MLSLAAGVLWWVILLAVYVMDRAARYDPDSGLGGFISTVLFFLPALSIILGLVALKRVPPPARTGASPANTLAAMAAILGIRLALGRSY